MGREPGNDLPDTWFDDRKSGRKIKKDYRPFVPERVQVAPDGSHDPEGETAWFFPAPFLACLCCGVVYDRRSASDYSKLARLSSEGRSSATTLLGTLAVQKLRDTGAVEPAAQKLLSFTDNRQDASLQAGHFNDFIAVARLRMGLARALAALGPDEALSYTDVGLKVVEALALPESEYARTEGLRGQAARETRQALQAYVEYRLFHDLRRGWRVNLPNLEQCGLLRIEYTDLDELSCDDSEWGDLDLLRRSTPQDRRHALFGMLEYMRRNLALSAQVLDPDRQDELQRRVRAHLKAPWCLDPSEMLQPAALFVPPEGEREPGDLALTERGAIGRFLGERGRWLAGQSPKLNEAERREVIEYLLARLLRWGLIVAAPAALPRGFQVKEACLRWRPGNGRAAAPDPVRSRRIRGADSIEREPNAFFHKFYNQSPACLLDLRGAEHTGQIDKKERERREERFRADPRPPGEPPLESLKLLFCSPTMELGIDIADLNLVHMRNVPPTPANYAQRAGRAGRKGQPAVIFSYCSSGSGHDQYYFERQAQMVAGAVAPPQIDLLNEDLIRAHVHAVWLAHCRPHLGRSVSDSLDMDNSALPLRQEVRQELQLNEPAMQRCLAECRRILSSCGLESTHAAWFSEQWLGQQLQHSPEAIDRACDRWRHLYQAAERQIQEARLTIDSVYKKKLSRDERQAAESLERDAKRMRDILCYQDAGGQADYYIYRYLATEGFRPGYNFPRLPIGVFLTEGGKEGTNVLRPRFLALTEFGPRNIIYHDGGKYRVVRTQLPLQGAAPRFVRAKLCQTCGTFHDAEDFGVERCQTCGGENFLVESHLFEMTQMTATAIERITSDEEERVRQGYEVRTYFRYPAGAGQAQRVERAEVVSPDAEPVFSLEFSQATSLWRINHGWKRSAEQGFHLDTRQGYWCRRPSEEQDRSGVPGQGAPVQSGVKLLVRDTRNTLLLTPSAEHPLTPVIMLNLQYALQRGIQAEYQLEESELAVEMIPRWSPGSTPRSILIWEAAEGGAGVLRRLIDDPEALGRVAREALGVLHFRPTPGGGPPEDTNPDCGAACYRCLLSYSNQPDHENLDRSLVSDVLLRLAECRVVVTDGSSLREEHYRALKQQTDPASDLERSLLDVLYEKGYRLPDHAQKRLADFYCQPDFTYDETFACIFCDGSVHDPPKQVKEDRDLRAELEAAGYRVVTIRYDRDLEEQIREHPDVFGRVSP